MAASSITPEAHRTGHHMSRYFMAVPNQAADVLIALRQGSLDIVNAAIEQPTLDEVFMALTGHASATSTPEPEVSAA
jgi:ABC-2 type transport system ATP-binding protein